MVNPQELAICKKRGHAPKGLGLIGGGWAQCQYCGMWLREVKTIEERENEPPKDEQTPSLGR